MFVVLKVYLILVVHPHTIVDKGYIVLSMDSI